MLREEVGAVLEEILQEPPDPEEQEARVRLYTTGGTEQEEAPRSAEVVGKVREVQQMVEMLLDKPAVPEQTVVMGVMAVITQVQEMREQLLEEPAAVLEEETTREAILEVQVLPEGVL